MVHFRELALDLPVFVDNTEPGFVRFLGRVKFAPGEWVGVELLHPDGQHDGSVQGLRYFRCQPNHGVIVHTDAITLRGDKDSGGDGLSPHPGHVSEGQERKESEEDGAGALQRSSSSGSQRSSIIEDDSRMNRLRQATSAIATLRGQPHRNSDMHPPTIVLRFGKLPRGWTSCRRLIARVRFSVLTDVSHCFATLSSTVSKPSPAFAPAVPSKSSSTLLPSASTVPSLPPAPFSPSVRRLWLWGENTNGELSSGDELDIRTPLELRNFSGKGEIAQFSLGLHHTVCLTLSNDVYTAGSWISGLLGHDERANVHRLKKLRQFAQLKQVQPTNPIISIGCGDRHSVALHASGELYTWGGTLYGKLGRTGDSNNTYYLVSSLAGKRVTGVSVGNCHTCVCTDEGEVYTFGGGGKHYNKGALGTGDTEDSMLPRRIPTFGNSILVRNVCCGGYHTLALTADRRVYAWGRGEFGQLGLGHDNNETEPKLIEALAQAGRVTVLAAGENHSLACLDNGEVYSWGYGQQGQLGHGSSSNEKLPKLVTFFAQRNVAVTQVAAGWRHSLALTTELHVYSWGHGDKGQLGLGDTKSSLLPRVVESLLGKEVRQVAAGGSHSLAFNAFFKNAQQLYAREQLRQEKEMRRARGEPVEEDDDDLGRQRAKRGDSDSAHSGDRGQSNEEKSRDDDQFRSPNHHSKPFNSTLTPPYSTYSTSSALSNPASQLCVELVYSAQVQLTHRFITFQTTAPAATFTPLIHTYIEQQYSDDPGLTFDNFIISPGNVLPRGIAHPTPTLDPEVGEHVYEYDDGPVRVTVMMVTRTHAEDENLWPPWAAGMYERIKEACGSREKAGVFQPCFREIRPAALREIIQQRQRKSGR